MKCVACHKKFKDGERVIPIQEYVTNEKRGDWISSKPLGHIHLKCVKVDTGE